MNLFLFYVLYNRLFLIRVIDNALAILCQYLSHANKAHLNLSERGRERVREGERVRECEGEMGGERGIERGGESERGRERERGERERERE